MALKRNKKGKINTMEWLGVLILAILVGLTFFLRNKGGGG